MTDKKMRLIKYIYYIIANTLITLVIILTGSHMFLKSRSTSTIDNFAQNFSKERRAAYAHMSDQEVNELLNATWNPAVGGWRYDDWVGFKEAPRRTRFVNVNEEGIRQNSSEPLNMADLNGSVWFFGGSTTFGYGVADKETIPAKLESILKTKVVNFGRGYFYSAQENQLLRQYLKAGYRPKLTVFLDGVNERCEIEAYQKQMESLFKNASQYSWDFTDAIYPVTVTSKDVLTKLGFKDTHDDNSQVDLHELSCTSYGKTMPLTYVLQQNLSERQAICAQYSLNCTTYVQPFAGVHGIHSDLKTYKLSDRKRLREKYASLASTWAGSGSIFIADALDNLDKHAYVDDCHYSAEASELIAKEVAENLAVTPLAGALSPPAGISQVSAVMETR